MPRKKSRSLRCPTCRTIVMSGHEHFPFCSDRCRLIDLGKWASGGYVISTSINDPEMLESLTEDAEKDRPPKDDSSPHKH